MTPIFLPVFFQTSSAAAMGSGGEEDYHLVLNVALVDSGTDPDMAGRDFREDERVFEQDVGRGIQDRLDEPWVLPDPICYPDSPGCGCDVSEPFRVSFCLGIYRRSNAENIPIIERGQFTDESGEVVSFVYEWKSLYTFDLNVHEKVVGSFL